uniref:Transcription factor TFIIIC triple barrel domain-containing protein n=1 Tax=Leersia perrieri TaxID=77586 RepID=A0A0D9W7G0_9ORYZ
MNNKPIIMSHHSSSSRWLGPIGQLIRPTLDFLPVLPPLPKLQPSQPPTPPSAAALTPGLLSGFAEPERFRGATPRPSPFPSLGFAIAGGRPREPRGGRSAARLTPFRGFRRLVCADHLVLGAGGLASRAPPSLGITTDNKSTKDIIAGEVRTHEKDMRFEKEEREEEEEEYVLLELDDCLYSDIQPGAPYGLDTLTPTLILGDDLKMIGEYEETIGTCYLFSETNAPPKPIHREIPPSGENMDKQGTSSSKDVPSKEVKHLASVQKILKFRSINMDHEQHKTCMDNDKEISATDRLFGRKYQRRRRKQ